jgi:hypothetical protein
MSLLKGIGGLLARAGSRLGNALANVTKPTRQDQLDALQRMGSYLMERDLYADTPVQQLVNGTCARASSTLIAIHGLVANQHPLQAAMLSRPLFEDMVVAHWVALHDDDPGWLLERFLDHRDAMRLAEARARRAIGWSEPDVSDIIEREAELKAEYGQYAERDWWGKDNEGSRIRMPRLVELLSEASRFQPRLKGEQPILRQYYAVVQKFGSQCLHHTAAGMEIQLAREGGMPGIAPPPDETQVLAAAYWTYGQLVYLVLELQPADFREFEEIFLDGLYNVFGPAAGL